jgi:hypothetical protein
MAELAAVLADDPHIDAELGCERNLKRRAAHLWPPRTGNAAHFAMSVRLIDLA